MIAQKTHDGKPFCVSRGGWCDDSPDQLRSAVTPLAGDYEGVGVFGLNAVRAACLPHFEAAEHPQIRVILAAASAREAMENCRRIDPVRVGLQLTRQVEQGGDRGLV